jgi:hypothetical protein
VNALVTLYSKFSEPCILSTLCTDCQKPVPGKGIAVWIGIRGTGGELCPPTKGTATLGLLYTFLKLTSNGQLFGQEYPLVSKLLGYFFYIFLTRGYQ